MPETYVQSHLPTTATNAGHAPDKSTVSKTKKYQSVLQTHLFTPIAIETAGVWNSQAREFNIERAKQENSSKNLRNVSALSPGK